MLNLSPEDQAEYHTRWKPIALLRDEAVRQGDHALAKKCRQRLSALGNEYAAKELPVSSEPVAMPHAEICDECDQGTHGLSGSPKWCCYCGARLRGNGWYEGTKDK